MRYILDRMLQRTYFAVDNLHIVCYPAGKQRRLRKMPGALFDRAGAGIAVSAAHAAGVIFPDVDVLDASAPKT